MKLSVLKSLTLAAGLALGASFAHAGAADDAIKGRQGCMKANGGMMGVAVPMIKGEKPYDKAALDAAFAGIDAACAKWDTFWGADTQKGESAETWALPKVWEDAEDFQKDGNASYQAMTALRAAADEAAFKAAFPAVGAACKDCHEEFRRPKN